MKKSILAFVHIEKTAGTTFIQILRRNFFLRFVDVRPLSAKSDRQFTQEDFRKYRIINPLTTVISGHAIRPGNSSMQDVGTDHAAPNFRYVTLLRDPCKRYISQYLYFVRIKSLENNFENYLCQEEFENVQTKKLAVSGDVREAIATLNRLFAVGVAEEFDTFLLRLKKALEPIPFDPRYAVRNVNTGTEDEAHELLQLHGADIQLRNSKDQQLYDYATNDLIPGTNKLYGSQLADDLARFGIANRSFRLGIRDLLDYSIRKFYYEPISGVIRRTHGLRATGSY